MELTRCEIRWVKWDKAFRRPGAGYWKFIEKGGVIVRANVETKAEFIKRIAGSLKDRVAAGEPGFSLRIYKKNGQIQSERTYGPDPRKSKG